MPSFSAISDSAGSMKGWNEAVFTELVRRYLVRLDVDLGNSGLPEEADPNGLVIYNGEWRLRFWDSVADATRSCSRRKYKAFSG